MDSPTAAARKPLRGVEHGVPVGDHHIEGVDLPQNLRGEDEAENGDLQGRGSSTRSFTWSQLGR